MGTGDEMTASLPKTLAAAFILTFGAAPSAFSYSYGDAVSPDQGAFRASGTVEESTPTRKSAAPAVAKPAEAKPLQPVKAEPQAQPQPQPSTPQSAAPSGGQQAAPSAPSSGVQAAAAAVTPSGGDKLFDGGGSKQGGTAVPTGGALGGTAASSPAPAPAPASDPVPVVASAPPAARPAPAVKGLNIEPLPVPEGAPVAGQTQDSGFDAWLDAMRRRASSAWDSVSSGVSGFAGDVKRLLSEAGDSFKKAFMAVWDAPDTKTSGAVNNGRLGNGIQMPDSPYYSIINRRETWGAKHTILGLMYIGARLSLSGAPTLKIGDISGSDGGKLGGHKSHQRGLDFDLPFFYNKNGGHDARSNYQTLELLHNNPFMTVEMIFVSPRVKSMLLRQAKEAGDGALAAWAQEKLLTSEPGHDNHYHVRVSPEPKFASWLGGALGIATK